MRKEVKVIRSANKTIVIYQDSRKKKLPGIKPDMSQKPAKPVPVYRMGQLAYRIMPDGRYVKVRRSMWSMLINALRRPLFA